VADRKISDLTALTTPATGDLIPIVDISEAAAADKNKSITVGELLRGAPDGTAAAPGIAFESDPDSGIYSAGANQVAISTGGSQRLLVESTGLTVNGTTTLNGTTLSLGAEGGANGFINAPESIYFNIDSNNGETGKTFIFAHNATDNSGTELLRIQDDGKVGIGTSSVDSLLHIESSGTPTITLEQTGFKAEFRAAGNDLEIRCDEGDTGGKLEFYVGGGTTGTGQKMTILPSGRVGIGVTSPSATLSCYHATNNTIATFQSGDSVARATFIDPSGQAHVGAQGDNLVFNVTSSATEAARIDSSSRLLVGASSAINTDGSSLLQVVGASSGALLLARNDTETLAGDQIGAIRFFGNDTLTSGGYEECAAIKCNADADHTDSSKASRLVFLTTGSGAESSTERMRINQAGSVMMSGGYDESDSNYYLILGTSSVDAKAPLKCIAASTGARTIIGFFNPNGVVGTITTTGSATAYNTSSDYRLKENVVDLDGAITRVKQLAPKRFNFIGDDTDAVVDGFLAHEAQTVVPEAVTGTHNEVDNEGNPVYQGIDQSKLVPLLTAALQEAIAKIETLEAKVAALEAN
jgi:hypothetical protein